MRVVSPSVIHRISAIIDLNARLGALSVTFQFGHVLGILLLRPYNNANRPGRKFNLSIDLEYKIEL